VFKVVVAALDILHQALRSTPRDLPRNCLVPSASCSAVLSSCVIGSDSSLARCSAFGPKVVAPQPLIKALPALFDAKQEPVRDGVKKLAVRSLAGMGALACLARRQGLFASGIAAITGDVLWCPGSGPCTYSNAAEHVGHGRVTAAHRKAVSGRRTALHAGNPLKGILDRIVRG